MRTGWVLLFVVSAGCDDASSGSTHIGGPCDANAECVAGAVCDDGACVALCTSDAECYAGTTCRGRRCLPTPDEAPTISSVLGDGVDTCVDVAGPCIDTGVLVSGSGLSGATLTLAATSGQPVEPITVSTVSRTQVHVALPGTIAPGDYVLTATNAVGSVDQTLTLLQGPQGPQGPQGLQGPPGPDLDAAQLVARINGGSAVFASSVLPVGTTGTDVAAGDHDHDGTYLAIASAGDFVRDSDLAPAWNTFTPSTFCVADNPPPQYRVVGDEVCLRGRLDISALGCSVTNIGSFVSSLAPPGDVIFAVWAFEGGGRGNFLSTVGVGSNGQLWTGSSADLVQLDGVCYSTTP